MPTSSAPEAQFRDALSRFASGVTVVAADDLEGRAWGFTASSFCSLSADPPLVLVCLARSAECHPAFMATGTFAISILRENHQNLALVFASRGADKFAAGHFDRDANGQPVASDALATLTCRVHERHEGGDHVILIGEVTDASVNDGSPLVYFNRGFRDIAVDEASVSA